MRQFILFLFISFLFVTHLSGAEKVIWQHKFSPPELFKDSKYEGEGTCDSATFKAVDILNRYRIESETEFIPNKRFMALMEKKDNYCYSCFYKTPKREAFMHFSKPYYFMFNNVLVTRAEDEKKLQPYLKGNNIDLIKLLKDSDIKLGIYKERSFGNSIDQQLLQLHSNKNIKYYDLNLDHVKTTVLQHLFQKNVIDATIGYPSEIIYQTKELNIDKKNIKLYNIVGEEQFAKDNYGYISCSKSDFGKKIIEIINSNINEIRDISLKKQRKWLDKGLSEEQIKYEPEFYRLNP